MKKLLLVALAAMFLMPSFASAGIGLGVKGGIASSSDIDENMTHIGADLRFGLPMIEVIVSGEYSWKNTEMTLGLGTDVEAKNSMISGTASAVYSFALPVITPYAGGGVGSHTMIYDVTGLDKVTETKMGYHFLGGVKFGAPTLPVKLYAEYRHYWVPYDEGTAKYYTLAAGIIIGM